LRNEVEVLGAETEKKAFDFEKGTRNCLYACGRPMQIHHFDAWELVAGLGNGREVLKGTNDCLGWGAYRVGECPTHSRNARAEKNLVRAAGFEPATPSV
jgi:hypothetical protein